MGRLLVYAVLLIVFAVLVARFRERPSDGSSDCQMVFSTTPETPIVQSPREQSIREELSYLHSVPEVSWFEVEDKTSISGSALCLLIGKA